MTPGPSTFSTTCPPGLALPLRSHRPAETRARKTQWLEEAATHQILPLLTGDAFGQTRRNAVADVGVLPDFSGWADRLLREHLERHPSPLFGARSLGVGRQCRPLLGSPWIRQAGGVGQELAQRDAAIGLVNLSGQVGRKLVDGGLPAHATLFNQRRQHGCGHRLRDRAQVKQIAGLSRSRRTSPSEASNAHHASVHLAAAADSRPGQGRQSVLLLELRQNFCR